MSAWPKIRIQRTKTYIVRTLDYVMKISSFFISSPPRLRMIPYNVYLASCLILLSFLFDVSEACWDKKIAPDYGEMTKDYDLLVGSDLVLECTLKRTNFTSEYNRFVNSSNLVIEKGLENLSHYTKQIDQLTLQLRIPNATEKDTGLYLCKIFINSTAKPLVCGSQVAVGYPPQNVSNFTCLNRNYKSLRCSWNVTKNNVKTKYSIVKYIVINQFAQKCPNNAIANSCEWSHNSSGFLTFGETISFTVTGTNSLGISTNNFTLNSAAIVITTEPESLKTNVSSQSITLEWSRPSIATSDTVNLRYQIWLSSNTSETSIYDAGTNTSQFTITNLIPYTSYNVSVRCRSLGTDKEDMWSPFAYVVVKTLSDVPYKTPEIIPEAYELHYFQESSRYVSLYWKNVPDMYHNGENFHYVIKYFQKAHGKTSDVFIVNSSTPFINIKNLQKNVSYYFHLYSANENGLSKTYKVIFLAPEDEILPAPRDVRVISLDFGLYNLSWNPPTDEGDNFNYTIFWCSNLTPWRNRCDGSIQWLNESLLDTNKILNLSDIKANFEFSVVAQRGNRSSGMQWASCIVPQKGHVGKIKNVLVIPETSTSLKVIWKLDCPARKTLVKRYEISYCKLPEETKCNMVEVSPDSEEFLLENLHPFSYYKVRIQAVSNENNRSENSDPVYQKTFSGAPSGPPQNISVYSNSSNSFIITWMPPAEPNGIITKYIITYNGSREEYDAVENANEYSLKVGGLKPYSKYAVQIEACVSTDCSEKSEAVMIRTDVDVPGDMESPRINYVNSTHLQLLWREPAHPNGPIDFYVIKWHQINQNDTANSPNIIEVSHENSVILDVKCPTENEVPGDIRYLFYIRPVNVKDGANLTGQFSESTEAKACEKESGLGTMLIGIIIGSLFVLCGCVIGAYKLLECLLCKINQVKSMKIRLPEGLEGPETNPLNNYEFFKNGLNGNIQGSNIERLSYIIDENKNRHGSGSSQFSNSSAEELIFKNGKCIKFGRKPSGDSSGCSSMSSNATPRIQLSSDSGTESDFAIPPSPDSAITDQSLHNPHKSPLPIVMEVHDQTSSEKQSLQQEFSPDRQFYKHKTTDPPYSKFGIAGNSTASVNPLAFYSCNLANSEPSVFDAQKPDKTDVVMAPYSKVGLAKSSGDLSGTSSKKLMGYSKFGNPVSQKRFSIPPPNVNPITMILLENSDKKKNIRNALDDKSVHSKVDKEKSVRIPSNDLIEDCGYIKVGRSSLCSPSHGYVPFNDLKSQMEQNPLSLSAEPAVQILDAYDTSQTDENQIDIPTSEDWSALNQSEGEHGKENIAGLSAVPFLINSNGAIFSDGVYNSNSSNLPCCQNTDQLLIKTPSELNMKLSSDSSTSSEFTNESDSFLQNEVSSLTDVNVLDPKDNPTPNELHCNAVPGKTNNYGLPNEVIVNPVTLRNGYVPFHSLTNSVWDRTLNHLPKVPEPNAPQTIFPNGIHTEADNYLASSQKGDTRLLSNDPLSNSSSVLSPVKKDLSNVEKPVPKENGYSTLSLKYILKPLPKMESEICEV